MQRDDSVDALREILARNRAALSDVERTVVMERFAIGTGGKGRTLSEVGKLVGLTNERVRQIQNSGPGEDPGRSGRAVPGRLRRPSCRCADNYREEGAGADAF